MIAVVRPVQFFAGARSDLGAWWPSIDKYITVEKPWTLAEKPEDRERLATVLYTAAEGLRIVTALAHPVLPQATEKIWRQLGQTEPLSGCPAGPAFLGTAQARNENRQAGRNFPAR